MRTIKVGDKEIRIKGSTMSLFYYEKAFGKDLLGQVGGFADVESDMSKFSAMELLRICYALNETYNCGRNMPGFKKWVEELGLVDFGDTEWSMQLLEEVIDGVCPSGEVENSKKK